MSNVSQSLGFWGMKKVESRLHFVGGMCGFEDNGMDPPSSLFALWSYVCVFCSIQLLRLYHSPSTKFWISIWGSGGIYIYNAFGHVI